MLAKITQCTWIFEYVASKDASEPSTAKSNSCIGSRGRAASDAAVSGANSSTNAGSIRSLNPQITWHNKNGKHGSGGWPRQKMWRARNIPWALKRWRRLVSEAKGTIEGHLYPSLLVALHMRRSPKTILMAWERTARSMPDPTPGPLRVFVSFKWRCIQPIPDLHYICTVRHEQAQNVHVQTIIRSFISHLGTFELSIGKIERHPAALCFDKGNKSQCSRFNTGCE